MLKGRGPFTIATLGTPSGIHPKVTRDGIFRRLKLFGPGLRLEPHLLMAAVAEGLVVGAAAAAEG